MPPSRADLNDSVNFTGIDRVIHEPARLAILAVLRAFESVDFTFLLNQTELSRGNLSSHLSKLEAASYVAITKEFVEKVPRTLVRLTDAGRAAIASYRSEMDRILASL
ncbi:transcriptional regulator [Candidatus Bipolaricaulota bacterium]|nr:transcriptional regulator [Candidatus Bipolaricaulota bacterium]